MTIEQELQIVEAAKTNVGSFGAIYDYYFGRIYAFCYNRVLNKELAEDIVSQTFLAAIQSIAKFDTRRGVRFGSWLYKTANSKICDHFRHNKRYVFDLENLPAELQAEEGQQEKKYREQELKITVAKAMKNLHPRYQQILALKFYAELEQAEMAEVLDLKISQVAVVLHRANLAFKKEYLKNCPVTEIF